MLEMIFPARDRIGFVRLLFACLLTIACARAGTIQYNRDIRPILSENCYQCHGPDKGHRKAGLRLDVKEEAFKKLDAGDFVIAPGDLEKSALVHRITTTDDDDHMPPAKSGKKLTGAQIDTLKQWIKEGAEWQGHWAYQKVIKPVVADVKNKEWARNEIDRFILARLEKEGMDPSSEA